MYRVDGIFSSLFSAAFPQQCFELLFRLWFLSPLQHEPTCLLLHQVSSNFCLHSDFTNCRCLQVCLSISMLQVTVMLHTNNTRSGANEASPTPFTEVCRLVDKRNFHTCARLPVDFEHWVWRLTFAHTANSSILTHPLVARDTYVSRSNCFRWPSVTDKTIIL